MFYIFLTCLLVFSSCSNINTESRQYYQSSKEIRHGIVPKAETFSKEKWEKSLNITAVKEGKKLYQDHCIQCHGIDGKGDGPQGKNLLPPPKDLTKLAAEVPNFDFFIMVSKWQGNMPGWKKPLNPKQIEQVEQYIRSLSK